MVSVEGVPEIRAFRLRVKTLLEKDNMGYPSHPKVGQSRMRPDMILQHI